MIFDLLNLIQPDFRQTIETIKNKDVQNWPAYREISICVLRTLEISREIKDILG